MYLSDLKHPKPALEDKLHQLYSLKRDKNLDLSFRPPFLNLLKSFGDPHKTLPPVIHVAGTNGKGSIIAMLRAILEAGGYRVHSYTSPHLQKFNERITLAGKNIDDEMLEGLIDEALAFNQGDEASFFEITTAMGFAAFARVPADILLLEVGLGGRLDCTNIIPTSLVSVINVIAYDHMEQLGSTLPEIAAEKAGIMKPHVPCVIGAQTTQAIEKGVENVFKEKACALNVELYCARSQWVMTHDDTEMTFSFEGASHSYSQPNLVGQHQIDNAGVALATLKIIENQFPLQKNAIIEGLHKASWAGRLQDITDDMPQDLPEGWEVWLDGGHNENAAQALALQAQKWRADDAKPLHLIMGMLAHKNPLAYLRPLAPYLETLTLIDIPDEPKSLKPEAIIPELQRDLKDIPMTYAQSVEAAFSSLSSNNKDRGRILIGGSLYLAGHILANLSQSSS